MAASPEPNPGAPASPPLALRGWKPRLRSAGQPEPDDDPEPDDEPGTQDKHAESGLPSPAISRHLLE